MIKPLVIQALILLIQAVLYFGIEYFEKDFHDVKRDIDDRIPEIPLTIFVYVLWFPLIAFYPVMLYFHSGYIIYIVSVIVNILLSTIIYYVYPTSFVRPDTDSALIGIARKLSYKKANCVPSMHCSMCTMIIISSLYSGFDGPVICGICVLSVLIILSTLTTKQHAVLDVVTGVVFGAFCYFLVFALTALLGV